MQQERPSERWQDMPDSQRKRKIYMASREWGFKRQLVAARSGGICEHCKHDAATEVHHLHYDTLYHENLVDLKHLCEPCHRFYHDLSKEDPRAYWKSREPKPKFQPLRDGYVQCPKCNTDQDNIHMVSVRVLQGSSESMITRDAATRTKVAAPRTKRNGPVVDFQFYCECGYRFTWHTQFRIGLTCLNVIDTPEELLRDDEFWRD